MANKRYNTKTFDFVVNGEHVYFTCDTTNVIVWTRNTRRKGGKKLNTRFQETRRQRRVLISRCTVPVIISITS
jgi:hypothetical protein